MPRKRDEAAIALDRLRTEAASCEQCDLYQRATQTVFGEGPPDARLVMIGEQPRDHEDKDGRPFVGPAGQLLDRALEAAGIDRTEVYLTNAVKHFKWRPSGKVRLHQRPNAAEIAACRNWWEAELESVRPEVLCCLGAIAAQAVLGKSFRVTKRRGEVITLPSGIDAIATIHPSAVLRSDDREAALAGLVHDLEIVRDRLAT
ncbi:MAG: uracil-DNA glycosylase [Actinomycetota bacterium]|nr:uracil-DNA glycosylase [Actinomycetota bacterium]